ncbi:hypothetical protein PybrP1_002638 [[Pythium] brassicae (nom. inval.)]|nr:hypothetical protein PybrP1_002638 [[Pythium] brassicae (nom. inval.)]
MRRERRRAGRTRRPGAYQTGGDVGVVAEIWDFRASATACPVSSAALPQSTPVALQTEGCSVWQMRLRAASPDARPRTASTKRHRDDAFAHFRELSPGELEILAGDAKRQLLEEGTVVAWSAADALQLSEPQCHRRTTQQQVRGLGLAGASGTKDPQGSRGHQTRGGALTPVAAPGGEWVDVGCGAATPSRVVNAANVRYNLTLDKEAFPVLARQRLAAPAILSPTEPKRQVIGDTQRQQVARPNAWSVPGAFVAILFVIPSLAASRAGSELTRVARGVGERKAGPESPDQVSDGWDLLR